MATELPQFTSGQTYLLTGDTLNQIMDWLREKELILQGGQFVEVGPQGSKLDVVELTVCIGGQEQTKKFVVAA